MRPSLHKKRNDLYIKRPLAVGTMFYILGLIGGRLQYDLLQFSLFFIIIITIVLLLYRYYRHISVGLYLIITFVGAGSIILNPIIREGESFIKMDGEKVWAQGQVLEVREYPYKNKYIIKPTKMVIEETEKQVIGLIQIDAKKEFQTLRQGDIISVSGAINALSFPRNPGAFNEHQYLLIRQVTTKIKANALYSESSKTKNPVTQRLSRYYGEMFEQLMPWEEAQLMKAMLIGDKTLLSKEIQTLYKNAGIAHVLAVSGLHISVIASILWWGLKKLKLPNNLEGIIVTTILWGYAGMTGFSVSITRTVIMTTIILLGSLLEEKSDPITSWSFAALILLIYNNLYLWDVGFQLSFVAVGSLILLTPFFNKLYFIPKAYRVYVAPLLAVTIGTTPLIAYYYYVISPIGLILNLFLVPLVTIVVTVGFLAMLIFPIQVTLAKWVIGSSYYLLLAIEFLSKIALKIPFSTLIVGKPSWLELGVYALFWGVVLWYLHLHLKQRQIARKYVIMFAGILGIVVFTMEKIPGNLQVTFLDVGQGDSIIITTPHHKTFIIDGGETGNGQKIEQFLKYKGIKKVDAMILTHAHTDHMNGLKELAMVYDINQVFLTETPFEDASFKEFYDTIQSQGIPIGIIGAGDMIKDKNIIMTCIYPFKDELLVEGNDASAVMILRHGGVSYYFTGDIEENFEKQMACFLKPNDVSILKVPHHGSKTSSTQELLSKVMPDIGIISCGRNNIYRHPHEEVVLRYEQNNIPLAMTKNSGAIMTYSNGEKVKIYTMEDKGMLWK